MSYQLIEGQKFPIKAWVNGVEFEQSARDQVQAIANLPFIHDHIAVMPDVHFGIGATVGSVIATKGAIVPAAVGVDLGCGMIAQRTSMRSADLPDSLKDLRLAIEQTIPVGAAFHKIVPASVATAWAQMQPGLDTILEKNPGVADGKRAEAQVGTLGGGNHFVEVCIDLEDFVWVVLHSGSRGIGNRIGTFFISKAKKEIEAAGITLPNKDLAYFDEHTDSFNNYIEAISWAQDYAQVNRDVMMSRCLKAIRAPKLGLPTFTLTGKAINCHHNYASKEFHFGADVWVTRKGAVSAQTGELGIIPGSMGAKSFIVEGLGNPDSFMSCSHGAGRRMGRKQAERTITMEQFNAAMGNIESRRDEGVLDECPQAYKDVDAVMAAQQDLVKTKHQLRQVCCVKG